MKQTIVEAIVLFDGQSKLENKFIVLEGSKIVDVTSKKMKADYSGFVTPAFIDAHSHIGMNRAGEPYTESECNDMSNHFLPLLNPIDSIYFDDMSFEHAVDFGVLYSCVVPGSGNLIGGKAKVIRNFAKNRETALVHDLGYKMALGWNPRSTQNYKGTRQTTRMGVYASLEEKFDETIKKRAKAQLSYEKKLYELDKKLHNDEKKLTQAEFEKEKSFIEQEFDLEFSGADKAILELLDGNKVAKVHVHKEDDILYLIGLVNKYGLKATAEHTSDVFNKDIFDKLAENNIPIAFGPADAFAYKTELKHETYRNIKHLVNSKALYCLMTDHPVTMSWTLRDQLKYFMIYGLQDFEAVSVITHNSAKILNINDTLGTIEPGKLASLTVWNKHPFCLSAFPATVIAEGEIIRGK